MKYANHYGYTDVNPYEVVNKISDKTLEIRPMDCKELPWKKDFHLGGFFGHTSNQEDQKWEISSNKNHNTIRIRLRKNGEWKDKYNGRYRLSEEPIKFYDYNF